MVEFLVHLVGFFLIWTAIELGRKPDSSYNFLQWQTWVQIALVAVGVYVANIVV